MREISDVIVTFIGFRKEASLNEIASHVRNSFPMLKQSANDDTIEAYLNWGYKINTEYSDSYGQYLCKKYGILIDPTPEQVEETIIKRVQEFKFSDNVISVTDDKYLTPELIKLKNDINLKAEANKIADLEKTISNAQAELHKLTS